MNTIDYPFNQYGIAYNEYRNSIDRQNKFRRYYLNQYQMTEEEQERALTYFTSGNGTLKEPEKQYGSFKEALADTRYHEMIG